MTFMWFEQAQGPLANVDPKVEKGMVLPFKPLNLTFHHVNYYVDPPAVRFYVHLAKGISILDLAATLPQTAELS